MSKSKLIAAVVASVFALGTVSGFAQGYKKEELSAEQKSEIRDRVERLKTERMKAESTNPAEPAKAAPPKKTSKAMKRSKATPAVAKAAPAPAVKTTTTTPKL